MAEKSARQGILLASNRGNTVARTLRANGVVMKVHGADRVDDRCLTRAFERVVRESC